MELISRRDLLAGAAATTVVTATETNDDCLKSDLIDLYEEQLCAQARDDFALYREMIHPDMKTNWWTDEISYSLQCFYDQLIANKRPRLAKLIISLTGGN
jgi:hypothetical protein